MLRKLYPIISLLLLSSCSEAPSEASINPETAPEINNIEGAYKLVSLQEQNDTVFVPYEGVVIYKFFVDNQWSSPAYKKGSSQVINMAGGFYYFDELTDTLTERLDYHMKDTSSIGELTKYKIEFIGDSIHQSGIYKKGTPDEWKVEEYWAR